MIPSAWSDPRRGWDIGRVIGHPWPTKANPRTIHWLERSTAWIASTWSF